MNWKTILAACSLAALVIEPSLASEPSLAGRTVVETAQQLKPGEFLWAPQVAPDGPLLIMVSLTTQRAVVYRNGIPIGITTVSTGKPGYETPTGIFIILQKNKDHRSNLYDDAPMPYMQRRTWSGVALHAGQLPGYPASHGCIRLPHEFARLLFAVTRLGITVVVTREAALPRIVAARSRVVLEHAPSTSSDFGWHPEISPTGPISIAMSTSDKKMVVLRNGIEIGRSTFSLDADVAETEAYTMIDNAAAPWLRISLPGQSPASGPVTSEPWRRFTVPAAFQAALSSVVGAGTTVVITRDSLNRTALGQGVELIAGEDIRSNP